jgi:hypothetical protein
VLQAGSGTAALGLLQEALNGQPVDAILMDLAMPGIDGWETIRRCAARGSATRRWPSSRPMPSTRGWTTTWASRRPTSSPSRCALTNCWTGWAPAGLQLAGRAAATARPRRCPIDAPRPDGAAAQCSCAALDEWCAWATPRHAEKLDAIEAEQPGCAAWLAPCAAWRSGFQFDRMTPLIQDAMADAPKPPEARTQRSLSLASTRGPAWC